MHTCVHTYPCIHACIHIYSGGGDGSGGSSDDGSGGGDDDDSSDKVAGDTVTMTVAVPIPAHVIESAGVESWHGDRG
eukprot:gene2-biopygen3375